MYERIRQGWQNRLDRRWRLAVDRVVVKKSMILTFLSLERGLA
jgi:hypothetical protein